MMKVLYNIFIVKIVKLLCFSIIFFSSDKIFAQPSEIYLGYDMTTRFAGDEVKVAHLYIFENHSVFYTSKNQLSKATVVEMPPEDNQDFNFRITTPNGDMKYPPFFIQTDRKSELISFHNYRIDGKSQDYFVQEKLMKPTEWELHEVTRELGGFNCQKATTDFGGRSYVAWYTAEIPINLGPWKLHGLPGAIVSVSDQSQEVSFELTYFEYQKEPLDTFKKIVSEDIETISCEENLELLNKSSYQLVDRISSKLPRGASITSSKPIIQTLQTICN